MKIDPLANDLTPAERLILFTLEREPKASAIRLAGLTGMSPQAVKRALKYLKRDELITTK